MSQPPLYWPALAGVAFIGLFLLIAFCGPKPEPIQAKPPPVAAKPAVPVS